MVDGHRETCGRRDVADTAEQCRSDPLSGHQQLELLQDLSSPSSQVGSGIYQELRWLNYS